MGRNAQKRLARKLRDDGAQDPPGQSARASVDDADSETRTVRRGPLWLRATIASPTGARPTDPMLDLALAIARGATVEELARSVAQQLPAEEVLLELDVGGPLPALDAARGGVSPVRGLAKREGQENVPGIEALIQRDALNGGPLVVENAASDPRLPLAMGARGRVGSLVAMPLVVDEVAIGVLAAARREVAGFPRRDVDVFTAMGDLIALDLVQARAMRAALTDRLTGALSRQAVLVLIERALERARRSDAPLAALLLDVDGLRELNERHGRAFGDRCLGSVAQGLARAVRGAELFGRVGADRFLVVFEAAEEALDAAARRVLSDALGESLSIDGATVALTASCGAAVLAPQEDTLSFLHRLDGALASAKGAGAGALAIAAHDDLEIPRADDEGGLARRP